jgi:hypothetical protein
MIFRRPLLTLAATVFLTAFASAQEVTAPTTRGELNPPGDALNATPARDPSGAIPTVPGAASDTPLMPDQTPSLVKPEPVKPATTEKTSKTELFEQDLMERIRYREARTKALADKDVLAAWERSLVARTDVRRRAELQAYYKLLFARILKIDNTIAKTVVLKAAEAEHRLTQVHIAPTIDENNASTSGRVFAQ